MTTIVTRAGKGSPLTHTEVDTNFTNLNTAKLEAGAIALGSSGTPSISFVSDTNTGIFSPGADQVAISTNGVQRLSIGSTGNIDIDSNTVFVDAVNNRVGIGTSSPTTTAEIRGSNNTSINSKGNLFVADGGTAAQAAGEGGQISLGAWLNGDLIAPHPVAIIKGVTESSTTNINTGALLFGTSDAAATIAERMRITSAGLVGIGTTSPGSPLTIESSAGNQVKITHPSVASYFLNATSGGDFAINKDGAERARIDSSGRLLVGTTDGSGGVSKLVVQGASNGSAVGVAQISYNGLSSAVLAANTDIGYLRFTDQGSNSGVFAQITASTDGTTGAGDYPGRLVFSTTADGAASPTERMRITSTGQVRLASAGITFNGDTATANELDDYEEGTWTPNQGSGLTVVGAFTSTGIYTKIGRQVFVSGSVLGATSCVVGVQGIITGNLPFTVGASDSGGGTAVNASFITLGIIVFPNTGTTDLYAAQAMSASASPGITFYCTYFV